MFARFSNRQGSRRSLAVSAAHGFQCVTLIYPAMAFTCFSIGCNAETAEVVGAKSASANIVSRDEHTVSAKADFFGRDLEWTRNCPGGGHGRVRLWGESAFTRITAHVRLHLRGRYFFAGGTSCCFCFDPQARWPETSLDALGTLGFPTLAAGR